MQVQESAVLRSQVGGFVAEGRCIVLATLPHLEENAILTTHECRLVGMRGFVRRFDIVGATLGIERTRLTVKDIEAIVAGHISRQSRMVNDRRRRVAGGRWLRGFFGGGSECASAPLVEQRCRYEGYETDLDLYLLGLIDGVSQFLQLLPYIRQCLLGLVGGFGNVSEGLTVIPYLEEVASVYLLEEYWDGYPPRGACLQHIVEELLVEVTVEGSTLFEERHLVGIDPIADCFVHIKAFVGECYAIAVVEVAGGIDLDIVGCLAYYLADVFSCRFGCVPVGELRCSAVQEIVDLSPSEGLVEVR